MEVSSLFINEKNSLENLSLSSGVFETSDLFYKNAVNLTCLNLEECGIETNDKLQEIIKNLTQLKYLQIIQYKSCEVSDYGFTGESETKTVGFSISNLKLLESLYVRINLSRLGDLTLAHISKLKRLKTLNIYCKNVSQCTDYKQMNITKLFFRQANHHQSI